MPRRPIFVLPLLLFAVAAIAIGVLRFTRGADAAGAILYHPSADCSGAPALVTLTWTPLAGASGQWLEISVLDNGFEAGTFTRVNLQSDQTALTMGALARSIPSYWRIVSESGGGQVASETRAFVACGGPFLLWGPLECRSFSSASVSFRWAPGANFVGEQWIEFDSDGDWDGDDFWRTGPFSPAQERVRRSGFLDGVGYLFRVVREIGDLREVSGTGWFQPDCTPEINPNVYGSDDRLLVPSIGVDAPVNIRDVGFDAVLGVPIGAADVVRYEFKAYPHLGGHVGGDGPKVIGGHLDYYYVGPAVFWDLASVSVGDQIHYKDGVLTYTYVVDWVAHVPFSESLNPYIEGSDGDTVMLITCFGVFDRVQFGGYNQRTIVHATRL
jgi:hypothetical protein